VAAFQPSAHGFAFVNAWPSQPAIEEQTPFGRVAIGNAAAGLCGGMVFAALDYWRAGVAAPTARPALHEPLYDFIVKRLIDSWHIPSGVVQYYQWMNLPDADLVLSLLGHDVVAEHGLSWRTLAVEWPQVRADLDNGIPVPLGVVTVRSVNPGDLGFNHQVVAYSYVTEGGRDGRITLSLYDPNSGPRDDVTLSFELVDPAGPATFTHTINISHPVRGFFRVAYDSATPPA
jgi:hypothetical protein